jgi:hypothetical protein
MCHASPAASHAANSSPRPPVPPVMAYAAPAFSSSLCTVNSLSASRQFHRNARAEACTAATMRHRTTGLRCSSTGVSGPVCVIHIARVRCCLSASLTAVPRATYQSASQQRALTVDATLYKVCKCIHGLQVTATTVKFRLPEAIDAVLLGNQQSSTCRTRDSCLLSYAFSKVQRGALGAPLAMLCWPHSKHLAFLIRAIPELHACCSQPAE